MGATSVPVGFVGLGHMGGNMAARFLAAGYTVFGEARVRENAQPLIGGSSGATRRGPWPKRPRLSSAPSPTTVSSGR